VQQQGQRAVPRHAIRPGSSRDITYGDGIRAAAALSPRKIAIRSYGRSLDYAGLVDRIDRVANLLTGGLGLNSGDRIAIVAINRLEYAELVCGASSAGIAVATIGPLASPAEISFICEDASVRAVFVDADLEPLVREAVEDPDISVIPFGEKYEGLLTKAASTPASSGVSEKDVFCIPYTSGSTGRPKGVLLSHRGRVLSSLCIASDHGCFTARDISLVITPVFHGAGMLSLLTPLLFGGTVELLHKFDIEELLAAISRCRATSTYLIPTHFAALPEIDWRSRGFDLSSLKVVMSGTAPLASQALEEIDALLGPRKLIQRYGSTETSVIGALRSEDQFRKRDSAGRPFPLVNLRIERPDGTPADTDEIGTVSVSSPYLFSGYLNLPEQFAAAMKGEWFQTGDVGSIDDEGYLFIVDRKNSMIITGGENVYPGEVERVVRDIPWVVDCCVVGLPHTYWGEAVTAFVVATPGHSDDAEVIIGRCKSALSRYKAPKEVVFVDELPRNAIGKIVREELKKRGSTKSAARTGA
jgi:long-chain acyl-CoA synthetase